MVANDGITQIDAVSQTFTDFFFGKRVRGEMSFFVCFMYLKHLNGYDKN